MSIAVVNHVPGMIRYAGKSVNSFGLDHTNLIQYNFNQQGFRGANFDSVPEFAFFGCSLVFGIGVLETQTFAKLFDNSHNYGLAGSYTDQDIMTVLEKYLNSELYTAQTNIAVVWKCQSEESLDHFYQRLQNFKILHFFCGTPLPYKNCYATPSNIDYDVSGTHYGPASHRQLWKILKSLFPL